MANAASTPRSAGRSGRWTSPAQVVVPLAAAALGALTVAWVRGAPQPTWPTYASVFEQVGPSVVNVHMEGPAGRLGTGFAVSPKAVVTARHLVDGVERVEVRDLDGRALPARVVGTDARTDLALLLLEEG